ncbi:MAG: Vacuolar protein sorting-associated protein 8 [Candelina submexicana]|nr:MAG: Vacuolar protein sorting-associated protein 8 [Candelina submexicana]
MSSLAEESENGAEFYASALEDALVPKLATPNQHEVNGDHLEPQESLGPLELSLQELYADGHEVEPNGSSSQKYDEDGYTDIRSQDGDSALLLSSRPERAQTPEQTLSIPDDTPSIQGSVLSSESSIIASQTSKSRQSPTSSLRPFDRRFQSRLSSSPMKTSHTRSPTFLTADSRHSSLSSRDFKGIDELESPPAPWEVVRWAKLRKITGHVFSEVGKRSFGRPTCISISASIALGTSKGIILIFDYHQNLRSIIGPGSKAVESGSITSLAISADHKTIAGGHANGSVFTWDITKAARPFLHIQPLEISQLVNRKSDGHASGAAVVHLGFLGTRHTAFVSADDRGMAFSHVASRGLGVVARTVKTTRILGRYFSDLAATDKPRKPSTVLAFSSLPLGNVERQTDSMGLVAMLTPYLLVIVSTMPVAQTQYKAVRPKDIAAHGTMSGSLAWFPAVKLKTADPRTSQSVSEAKLVYCWSNLLTLMAIDENDAADAGANDKGQPPSLQFRPRSSWKAEETIVAVQWLSRSVIGVLTITQRLIILEEFGPKVTESFDLVQKQIYHRDIFSGRLQSLVEPLDDEDISIHGVVADAFYMSFKVYKGRVFLLGFNDLSIGTLSNWADRLLALMEVGDFIGAIRLATIYFNGETDMLTIGLPDESSLRQSMVQEKLLDMISASLKFAFGQNRNAADFQMDETQLVELAEACLSACVSMDEMDFLFDEAYVHYEGGSSEGFFLETLEPFILDDKIVILPPSIIKSLAAHYTSHHLEDRLENMLCHLDTSTMDLDQVTTLCKRHSLYDALIYIWNQAIGDFVTPLVDLLSLISPESKSIDITVSSVSASKMFPYISYVLTGRIYPTGEGLREPSAVRAKAQLYWFIFSGKPVDWPKEGGKACLTQSNPKAEPSFPYLRMILSFDTSSFLSALNEAFEDAFLNCSSDRLVNGGERWTPSEEENLGLLINRQHIVSILLDVLNESDYTSEDTVYLHMFIARNLPKFPQFILLSGSSLNQVLIGLCNYPGQEIADDCQLSVEYLLSVYHPSDLESLVPLFKQAGFFRVLRSIYRSNKQYARLLGTYFDDNEAREAIFDCISDCLRPRADLSTRQIREIIAVVDSHAQELVKIDVAQTAKCIDIYAPSSHGVFVSALDGDPHAQYKYLRNILDPTPRGQKGSQRSITGPANAFREQYVRLLCNYDSPHVVEYINDLESGELQLEKVLPAMESTGIIDAAVMLMAREGQVRNAMDRLTRHLGTLEAALLGLLDAAGNNPDAANAGEAATDIVEALQKYSRVGVWLCQRQTKMLQPSKILRRKQRVISPESKRNLSSEELLWLELIDTTVRITKGVSTVNQSSLEESFDDKSLVSSSAPTDTIDTMGLIVTLRSTVQEIFTALLNATTSSRSSSGAIVSVDDQDFSFLRVLRAFLSRASSSSSSLSDLRAVLAGVFSNYSYEESVLALANRLLDKDLFIHVAEATELRQRGWRPRSQACGGCGRKIWGSGAGTSVWEAWAQKINNDEYERRQARRALNPVEEASRVAERGKGRAVDDKRDRPNAPGMVDPNLALEDEQRTQGSESRAEENMGPLVVFACRHTYHRKCLEKLQQRDVAGTGVIHDLNKAGLECMICK